MVGDGPLREEALAWLGVNGLTGNAWLPGERSDISEILRSLDILVLPSKAEGISNTILEAMASGLPEIATRGGGNSELVVDGETGYLVETENVTDMAEAMLRLTVDDEKRRQFSMAANRRIQQDFSIENMVSRYRRVYDIQ